MPNRNLSLHPFARPRTIAGYKRGSITRFTGTVPGDPTSKRTRNLDKTKAARKFVFHYNPNSLNLNTQISDQVEVEGMARDQFQQIPGTQTMAFSLYLNRVIDKHTNRLPSGTLHDLEILWQVINGPPAKLPKLGKTANYGFITPTPLFVWFGPHNKFLGYVNGLSITHAVFASDMTPTITELQVSMARTLEAAGVAQTGPGAPMGQNVPGRPDGENARQQDGSND